jgi:carbonic anhydrase/acetyltransferase-like protein (isoleucine patch superfamily)
VIIHGATSIGSRCFIGARSIITNSMIEDSVYIRSNAIVENVLLTQKSFVANNAVIEAQDMTIGMRKITAKEKEFILKCVAENREFSIRYKYSLAD